MIKTYTTSSQLRALVTISRLLCFLLISVLLGCQSGDGADPEDEGGVIGTGFILQGTASEPRRFVTNDVQIKSGSGERFTTRLGSGNRFTFSQAGGEGPWILRTALGSDSFRYGISYGDGISNIHSYSDLILRNWFARNDLDIDTEFNNQGRFSSLPTVAEYAANADAVFAIIPQVLESYALSGDQLLAASFSADDTGIDQFLDNNPVVLDGQEVRLLLTDPLSNSQSTTRSDVLLNSDFSQSDSTPPSQPGAVRALGSAGDEIVLVWEPSIDNIAVSAYQIYRDGMLVTTTPFPVYTDAGLSVDTSYRYEIAAVDPSGNTSARSNAVSALTLAAPDMQAPPEPTSLTSLSVNGSRVELIWGQSDVGDVVAFNVYRRIDTETQNLLRKVTSTVFTDATVSLGITYCYRVSALDASGNESSLSAEICLLVSDQGVGNPSTGGDGAVAPLAGLSIPDIDAMDCTQELSAGILTENTLVTAGCYSVTQDIELSEFVNLTLAAGTVLKFDPATQILIGTNASLTSNGSPESPVVLTGHQSTPGAWGGLVFNRTNNPANLIRNTVVQYAGGGGAEGAITVFSADGDKTRIRMENSLVRRNANYGLVFPSRGTIVEGFTGNLITENKFPASFTYDLLEFVTTGNDYTGNETDVLDTGRNVFAKDIVIPNPGMPIISNGIILEDSDLTIHAGVELRFLGPEGIHVDGNLLAEGTTDQPILLTSLVAGRGQWEGVTLSNALGSILDHVTIEHAGGQHSHSDSSLDRAGAANLYLRNAVAALSNVTLQEGAGYGFYLDGDSAGFSVFENIVVSGNAQSGLVNISNMHDLQGNSNLGGNDIDIIDVTGDRLSGEDAIWVDTGLPYRFSGAYSIENGSVTIEPGTTIVAGSGTQFIIERSAGFSAIGTSANPVIFRGETAASGFWGGLLIRSDSPLNKLEYVLLQDAGGSTAANSTATMSGAVRLACSAAFPASVQLLNTEISNSAGFGIYIDPEGCVVDIGENVGFINNQLGEVNLP
ncbi:MAG: hypothetical protein KTR32_10740 [Granulosicoccus sp.]|nr:hypothetical protein [Granulosicoccus sp.]